MTTIWNSCANISPSIKRSSVSISSPLHETRAIVGLCRPTARSGEPPQSWKCFAFNTVLRSIDLSPYEFDSGIVDHEIQPRLEINKFRPHVRSLTGIQDDADGYDSLLGSTLDEVNGKPTLMLILLRSNPNLIDRLRR